MEQFVIVLDNPEAIYFPGQSISGKVCIRSNNEETAKGLILEFVGRASVHWTETDSMIQGRGQFNNRDISRSFDSSEEFSDYQIFLLGDGQTEVTIPSGESSYPFNIQLPISNLWWTSYKGIYGKIQYHLIAYFKRSCWKVDYKTNHEIIIYSIADLNNDPTALLPGDWKTSKTFCCFLCASGPLKLDIRTEKTGFCPREVISLVLYVNNASNKVIKNLSVELIQKFTFFAGGRTKIMTATIAKIKSEQTIQPFDNDFWRPKITVPSVPPTNFGGCKIINLDYAINVEVHVAGVASNLKQSCPIIIGTVPVTCHQYDTISPTAPPLDD